MNPTKNPWKICRKIACNLSVATGKLKARKEKEIRMTVTQYVCPECGYKTKFAHHNTSRAELRNHRERERAMKLHPAGKLIKK